MFTSMSLSVLLNISHAMPSVTPATSSVQPTVTDRPGMFPIDFFFLEPVCILNDPLEWGQWLPFDGAAKQCN
jgi:hypothetical protein